MNEFAGKQTMNEMIDNKGEYSPKTKEGICVMLTIV